jgi:hypothetical protein
MYGSLSAPRGTPNQQSYIDKYYSTLDETNGPYPAYVPIPDLHRLFRLK